MEIQVLNHTLDKEQTKAALTTNKNSIIIAGAGSGKSLTMVGKIKYLVKYQNIDIKDILCIAFTNNAAKSLEERITKELNIENKVYTFHKLSLEILASYNITYHIAESDLLEYLITEILTSIPHQKYFAKKFLTREYSNTKEFLNYQKIIARFIRLFIANFYEIDKFPTLIKKAKKREKNDLKLIAKIYSIYLLEKNSQGLIDFDDMIYLATNLVHEKGLNKNYKYIIIDEYQDTSHVRENLIREIINKTGALITVVGDDFQSIYRFSGCDLNSFLDFSHNFKPVKKLYLTNTYRNSQELIKVAGSFIMANPRQITKNLKSQKSLKKPIIILYYQNPKKDFLKALNYLNKDNLMILGRNNNDIYHVLDQKYLNNNTINFQNKNIYYKTIHKAKGLEEENIIVINLTNEINSLPSKIPEERILNSVLIHKDLYPYEEERRLFYVALTRTQNYCYLFTPKKNPSIFIEELQKKYSKYLEIINL